MSSADPKLDALLRAVTPPSDLLERLRMQPYVDDAGLDEAVRDVSLPEGLLRRLAAIPLADDNGMDEALRNVPQPNEDIFSQLHAERPTVRRRKRPLKRTVRMSRIAVAMSLFVAVGLSLSGALIVSWLLNPSSEVKPGPDVVHQPKHTAPATKERPLEASWRMLAEDGDSNNGLNRNGDAARHEGDSTNALPPEGGAASAREMAFVAPESAADHARREALASGAMPAAADPLAPAAQLITSPDWSNWDSLPELTVRPTGLIPHGLDWPLVPGSNRQFLIDKKFHPFVVPQSAAALQTCSVPLSVEPTSYELTRRYLERNEMPPPAAVRSEDFLAAMDYRFPKPYRRELSLIAAGGPSPISDDGFSLLQLGVQAWQNFDTRHSPLHLVLLVDTSKSMRWGSRMEIVRRALDGLPSLLGPNDRLSLVAFDQAAHVLAEDLGREASSQFRAAANSLAAEGSTNFAGGLHEACNVARATLGRERPAVRIVLLTDGLLDLDSATVEQVQQQVAEAAREKIRLDVVDLGQQKKDSDPQLVAISKTGQGNIHRATSTEQVRWALREIVTGRSQLVARSARLQVTFNPKAVLEYRIIGHESNDWASLLPGAVEADFREGQAATGLFELRLTPDAPDDVAKVELTWYSPDVPTPSSAAMQKVVTTVRRDQFAGSMASAPPWWQQAAVAAYTAEVLRHSPFIFQRHPGMKLSAAWRRAQELSTQIGGRLTEIPEYAELVGLINQEMKAHPARGR